jgi:hypothetical protein
MPACPVPLRVCESLSHTSYCGDNDYTDALLAMSEWENDRDDWVIELQLEWQDARDAWVAEDPENRDPEDYDVPEPDPRDPEDYPVDPPPEPEMPEGYEDGQRACFGPFKEPEGDPTDDLPLIYNKLVTVATELWSGVGWRYASGGDTSDSSEVLVIFTYAGYSADGTIGSVTESRSGNSWDSINEICTPIDPGAIIIGPPDAFSVDYIPGTPTAVCELDESGTVRVDTSKSGDAAPRSLLGCPDSGIFATDDETGWSYTMEDRETRKLSEPKSKADLMSRARSNLPATWPDDAEGGACVALLDAAWPTIGEVHGEEWPACDSEDMPWLPVPVANAVEATARKVRFWWKIDPQIELGPITEEDPTPDPIDWWRGDYFRVTWQTCFFPKAWTEWKSLYDQYLIDKAAFDDWEDEGEDGPPQPEEPTHPGEQPEPRPTLSEDFTDTWTGPLLLADLEDEDALRFPGGPHVLDAPETEGELRVVNIRFYCYPDSPYGYLPQVTGEAYEDFEAEPVPEPEDP